jgi:PIN domain nuclease of toxin-antitoxin system
MLVAQARAENLELLTADRLLSAYGAAVRVVD